MTLFDASGTSAGVATTGGGTPALSIDLGGTGAGAAASSGGANMNMGSGAGGAAGTSSAVGGNALAMVAAGLIVGAAIVLGDAHPQGAGTAAGVATATGTAQVLLGVVETVSGSATTTGAAGYNIIVTGQIEGEATTSVDLTTTASGTAVGQATVGEPTVTRFRLVRGFAFGTSLMTWSYPLPIVGKATMVAHVIVERQLPALNAIVAPPKSFRWLQLLQRGDLPVFISDRTGPVSPFRVTFTLFKKTTTGTKLQVGPGQRSPVQGVVGEFYSVGRAGEGGQPGGWVIRWEFQRSFGGALQTEEMEYRVLDAVLAADPLDATVRIRKFGWN